MKIWRLVDGELVEEEGVLIVDGREYDSWGEYALLNHPALVFGRLASDFERVITALVAGGLIRAYSG